MVHLPNGIEKLGNNIHLFVFGGGQGENTAFQKNIEQFEKEDGAAAKIAKELKAQLEKAAELREQSRRLSLLLRIRKEEIHQGRAL